MRSNFTDYMVLAPAAQKNAADLYLQMGLLERRYNEPHRYYHTLGHIDNGYKQHEKFFGNMDAVMFFAWTYHDGIYDPRASDNEERSAKLFLEDNAKIGFGMEDADRVAMYILSTAHLGEKNVITDIDLSGLGSSPKAYAKNTRLIRQEYSFVDDPTWKAGRSAFLERFMSGPIYITPQFVAAYEEQAQANLAHELAEFALQ